VIVEIVPDVTAFYDYRALDGLEGGESWNEHEILCVLVCSVQCGIACAQYNSSSSRLRPCFASYFSASITKRGSS